MEPSVVVKINRSANEEIEISDRKTQNRSTFKIRISAEAIAEQLHYFAAFAGRDVAFAYGLLGEAAETTDQFLGVVFHIAEHIGDGITFDFVRVDGSAIFHVDADDVRVTEQIVQVAQRFLVGTDEENGYVVRVALLELVERENFGNVFAIDEAIDLAIAIAGDVGQNGAVTWSFIESMNRHHRKQLIDGPGVGQALEQAEISVSNFETRVRMCHDQASPSPRSRRVALPWKN